MSNAAQNPRDTAYIFTCGAFLVSIAICTVLVLIFAPGFSNVSGAGVSLESVINVNTDVPGSIERLAGIGTSRANSIVEFRNSQRAGNAAGKIYQKPDDLERVKGIGPKTVERMMPYVRFD